jgi:hypothetical protein
MVRVFVGLADTEARPPLNEPNASRARLAPASSLRQGPRKEVPSGLGQLPGHPAPPLGGPLNRREGEQTLPKRHAVVLHVVNANKRTVSNWPRKSSELLGGNTDVADVGHGHWRTRVLR